MKLMNKIKGFIIASLSFFLIACGSNQEAATEDEYTEVSIGVVGDVSREIWEDVGSRLEEDGIILGRK